MGYTHSHTHANHKTTKVCYNNNNKNYGKKALINKYMKDSTDIRAARIKHEKKKMKKKWNNAIKIASALSPHKMTMSFYKSQS